MNPFDDCVAKGRLKKVEPDIERVARELATAQDELQRARTSFAANRWDETVTQSYFAMSRCARAAINARGYRDTNLYGLCVGLQALFVDKGDLPENTVKQIREAKDLKDLVYAGGRVSPDKARRALAWLLVLAKAIFTQLALPGFDGDAIETTLPAPPDPGRTAPPSWGQPSSRPRGSSGYRDSRARYAGGDHVRGGGSRGQSQPDARARFRHWD